MYCQKIILFNVKSISLKQHDILNSMYALPRNTIVDLGISKSFKKSKQNSGPESSISYIFSMGLVMRVVVLLSCVINSISSDSNSILKRPRLSEAKVFQIRHLPAHSLGKQTCSQKKRIQNVRNPTL
jgi:hypothetical protein